MNIVFFQNCISPHQIPYIKEICNDERIDIVYLVVPRIDYDMRKEMGWNAETYLNDTGIKFILQPTDKEVHELLQKSTKQTVHLFSGIRADNDVYRWFLLSLKYQITRGIITEAPYTYDKPLWMHYFRFIVQDWKYISKIDYVFAIGESAEKYYRSLSKHWNVIPFIYVTENKKSAYCIPKKTDNNKLRLVFAGSLSKRKNVILLLKAITKLSDKSKLLVDIIGDGSERSNLETFVSNNNLKDTVRFLGVMSNEAVNETLKDYDILILPSLYDGWGAVINEALTQGLYAICSDNCGAKALLKNASLGKVFKSNSTVDLSQTIENCIANITSIRNDVQYRKEWSNCISGNNIAKYFIDTISKKENIEIPWGCK